jgi:hypothetical protein
MLFLSIRMQKQRVCTQKQRLRDAGAVRELIEKVVRISYCAGFFAGAALAAGAAMGFGFQKSGSALIQSGLT